MSHKKIMVSPSGVPLLEVWEGTQLDKSEIPSSEQLGHALVSQLRLDDIDRILNVRPILNMG